MEESPGFPGGALGVSLSCGFEGNLGSDCYERVKPPIELSDPFEAGFRKFDGTGFFVRRASAAPSRESCVRSVGAAWRE